MKRLLQTIFPALLLLFIFSGCDVMNPASGPSGPARSLFEGTWTLNTVTYTGLADDAVQTAFDQAPPKDFTGSTWQLGKDGNGSYTLANGTVQNISWSVNGGDALGALFHFKKVNPGEKPENVSTVYQMTISNNTATSMTLKSLVYLGNKNGYVVYSFTKVKG
jgi:hypothetical protein